MATDGIGQGEGQFGVLLQYQAKRFRDINYLAFCYVFVHPSRLGHGSGCLANGSFAEHTCWKFGICQIVEDRTVSLLFLERAQFVVHGGSRTSAAGDQNEFEPYHVVHVHMEEGVAWLCIFDMMIVRLIRICALRMCVSMEVTAHMRFPVVSVCACKCVCLRVFGMRRGHVMCEELHM